MRKFKIVEQMIFDKVCDHLAEQGRPSQRQLYLIPGICAYRGTGGRSCSVGCIMPDEIYNPMLEGLPADEVCERLGWLTGYSGLLLGLQKCHDMAFQSKHLRQLLESVALEFGLDTHSVHQIRRWAR